jgi:hypothetical protein
MRERRLTCAPSASARACARRAGGRRAAAARASPPPPPTTRPSHTAALPPPGVEPRRCCPAPPNYTSSSRSARRGWPPGLAARPAPARRATGKASKTSSRALRAWRASLFHAEASHVITGDACHCDGPAAFLPRSRPSGQAAIRAADLPGAARRLGRKLAFVVPPRGRVREPWSLLPNHLASWPLGQPVSTRVLYSSTYT